MNPIWISAAWAVSFDTTTLPLDDTPSDVGVSLGTIYVALPTGWAISDGAVVTTATPPTEAPDVLGVAFAGDDAALWVCNPDGLWRWTGGAAMQVSATGCDAVELGGGRVAARAGTLSLFDGGTTTDLGVTADVFAVTADGVGWATLGDPSISVLDSFGLSSLAAGGSVTDVAWGTDGGWLVGTEGPAQLREIGVDLLLLAFNPTQVGVGDFDGDGLEDRWAASDLYVQIWTASGTELFTSSPGAQVRSADVDGDGCSDLIGFGSDATLTVAHTSDCPAVDTDGDGVRDVEDCAPADNTVFPGAFESCDGVDEDCDGQADESDAVMLTSDPALEGLSFAVVAAVDGCSAEALAWAWTFAGDAACAPNDAIATCAALDNGTLDVSVTLTLNTGLDVLGTTSVSISNVAPGLDLSATAWGEHIEALYGELFLEAGEVLTVQLVADDVEADPVSFATSVQDGLFSEITPGGQWTVSADEGAAGRVVIHLDDGDGGTADLAFWVEGPLPDTDTGRRDTGPTDLFDDDGCDSGPSRPSSCGSIDPCCGVSGMLLLGLLRRRLVR